MDFPAFGYDFCSSKKVEVLPYCAMINYISQTIPLHSKELGDYSINLHQ